MRIIAHLDMDAFFAAVEERDRPRLKGLPIVVGADPKGGKGRGVVSTANYKAREYGIKSAMPISEAWRRSEGARQSGKPPAVFIAGSFERYGEASRAIYDIASRYSDTLERASIDEMYIDLSQAGSFEKAEKLCRDIKAAIKKEQKLTASIGLGPNKLIAKIASDREKPDGLTVVPSERAEKFLEPLPIRVIPGIGPKAEEVFAKRGVRTVVDAKKFSAAELTKLFGKWGTEMHEKLRGRDGSEVRESGEAKSIGKQKTFSEDVSDPAKIAGTLKELSGEVFAVFRESGFDTFKTVVLTVRFGDFATKNSGVTLKTPAGDRATIEFEGLKLLMPYLDSRKNPQAKRLRLIGLRIEKLS